MMTYKSIRQYDSEIHTLEQRMGVLHEKISALEGQTSLSDSEKTELAALQGSFDDARSRRDELKQKRAEQVAVNETSSISDPVIGVGSHQPGNQRPTTWRTASGEPVAMAGPGESFFDAVQATGRASEEDRQLSLGKLVRGMVTGSWKDAGPEQRALSTGQQSGGGFLLMPALSSRVIDLARDASVIVQAGASTVEMPTNELVLARVEEDPDVSWVAENQRIPQTKPNFGRLRFRAKKMAAIVVMSRELAADAPNAESEILRLLRIAIGQEWDRAALLGSGAGEEPRGVFVHGDVQEEDSVGAVDWDSFLDAGLKILRENGNITSIIHPAKVAIDLAKLKINAEANHYAIPPAMLSGVSRFTTNKLADSQALIGDVSQIMIGIRSGFELEVASTASLEDGGGFERDQIALKVRWRGDIQIAQPQHLCRLVGIT